MRSFLITVLALLLGSSLSCLSANAIRGDEETDTKGNLIAAPQGEYPIEARRAYLQGKGLFLVKFDLQTGNTREVTVLQSTGYAILDQAALKTLGQWRMKPHTIELIRVPVKYELEGGPAANLGAAENYVLSAPMPHYPRATVADGVHGKGQFQLIIDPKTAW